MATDRRPSKRVAARARIAAAGAALDVLARDQERRIRLLERRVRLLDRRMDRVMAVATTLYQRYYGQTVRRRDSEKAALAKMSGMCRTWQGHLRSGALGRLGRILKRLDLEPGTSLVTLDRREFSKFRGWLARDFRSGRP